MRDWRSRWFAGNGKYQEALRGDILMREYLEKKLRTSYVADIEIERSEKAVRVIIHTSRPGVIIGRDGSGSETLRAELKKLLAKHDLLQKLDVKLDIKEVKSAESNASIVAQMIVEGLEKRMPFRRVMKQTIEKVMANRDVQGIKISMRGVITGGMARKEKMMKGRIPLQTLRADVDYSYKVAVLPLGAVGIKVWIYKGQVFKKDNN